MSKERVYKNKFNLFYKDFDSVRDIVRSAFLYGGYSKTDYCILTGISSRKYEDAVRFMQAVFGQDYLSYENKGKEKYARLNYKTFENSTNPLARVAFFKGFTENDYNCFFYLLDILSEKEHGLTIDEIADEIAEKNPDFNTMGTIRYGINALVDEGYLIRTRCGKRDYYTLTKSISSILTQEELIELADFISFFKDIHNERMSLYTLSAKLPESSFDCNLQLTDFYPAQFLDSEVKSILESAINEKRIVKFTYTNPNNVKSKIENATPVRILSGDYGRQYVFCFVDVNIRCGVFRLDRISDLEPTNTTMEIKFDESYLDNVWCVSIPQMPIEHYIEIDFNFAGDKMLANRLVKSCRLGQVAEVDGFHRFKVTIKDYDEMLPMIRSFYGYIERINNDEVKKRIAEDLLKIGGRYGII